MCAVRKMQDLQGGVEELHTSTMSAARRSLCVPFLTCIRLRTSFPVHGDQ
jgi:hypothetical protein